MLTQNLMANFDCSYCDIFCYKEILVLFKRMVDKDLEARVQGRGKQKNPNSLTKFSELKIIGDGENICGSIYAWPDGGFPLGSLLMVSAGNKMQSYINPWAEPTQFFTCPFLKKCEALTSKVEVHSVNILFSMSTARMHKCHHANMIYFMGHDVPLLQDTESYSPSENTKFSQDLF